MNALNRQFRLAARPVGLPTAADWTYAGEPVPEPAEGQVLGFELAVAVHARAGQYGEGRAAHSLPNQSPQETVSSGTSGQV
jgi:NADPH-dependent curcumin reductase CurA